MIRRPPLSRKLAEDLARRAGNQAACRILAVGPRPVPHADRRAAAPQAPEFSAALARVVAQRRAG